MATYSKYIKYKTLTGSKYLEVSHVSGVRTEGMNVILSNDLGATITLTKASAKEAKDEKESIIGKIKKLNKSPLYGHLLITNDLFI